ncbi:MAG: hypothetical protein C4530_02870 [Desulfobacteraceae bacterium]|jgi:anti-anti-sigma regulatory factor|nr:MAG: hypothetical protein C4530_02870 [Desulfobacteraceae bacterium]
MATNFKIEIEPKGGTLHLSLSGNFDGASADELLNVIKWHSRDVEKIFVNTNGLRTIHPFGQVLFQNKYHTVKDQSPQLVFTGKNWEKMLFQINEPSRVNI